MGDGRRATGDGRRATGDGRRATGDGRSVLFAARSATALHRLLDVLPVFAGDGRVERRFALVPGSEFDADALAALERAGARTVSWDEACRRSFDLIVAASPKGDLGLLRGARVLLPHGAGFGKTVRGDGTNGSASGLDPGHLLRNGGGALATLHALAHPSQIARLAALSPRAAAPATVVGDPTLERMLASRALRERYRRALGTGARRLIVLTSTWGSESLLRRRPTLPADLAARLPRDAYQVALILHPNEHSRLGALDLAELLVPALDSGMILAAPFEEWAAVLIAADAVVTDHGSTALYAAALDRPVIAAYDGGEELIRGTPMAELLARSPFLDGPDGLEAALAAHRPGAERAAAAGAFAEQGRALERLRAELYGLLDLVPPAAPPVPRLLPDPAPPVVTPAAYAVRIRLDGHDGRDSHSVHVERLATRTDAPAHHLAAEHGAVDERRLRAAALLYRRAAPGPEARHRPAEHTVAWTAAGWVAHVLNDYPGCRTAGVVLSPSRCVAGTRAGPLLSVRVEPVRENGRVVRTDPAAVLSAVHAWLGGGGRVPASLVCVIGGRPFRAHLTPATAAEGAREV